MRRSCPSFVAFLLASAVVTLWAATQERQASSLDRAIPATNLSCDGGVDCIWMLAFRFDLPLGIEVDDARSGGTPLGNNRSRLQVPATTMRDFLNDFVQANPRYEWREIDGYAVLRLQSAWATGTISSTALSQHSIWSMQGWTMHLVPSTSWCDSISEGGLVLSAISNLINRIGSPFISLGVPYWRR